MSLVGRNVGIIARIVAGTIVTITSVMAIIGIKVVIKDGLNKCFTFVSRLEKLNPMLLYRPLLLLRRFS